MIKFLKRLFGRAPQRRDLFYYTDGSKLRRIDPLIVVQLLEFHDEFTWDSLQEALNDSGEAQLLCGRVAIETFGVQAFDDRTGLGLTLAQRIDLLEQFYAYMNEVKKNIAPLPTSPPASDATPSKSSEPTTSDSSVSI